MSASITRRTAIVTTAAVAAAAGLPAAAQAPARVRLRVLETSDLHVNIVPYDYYRDGLTTRSGWPRPRR